MIISFDPGDTTGVAIFTDDGREEMRFQMPLFDLLVWLDGYPRPVSRVIYEDFKLFRKRAESQVGSRMVASQVIGALKMFAIKKGCPTTCQPSRDLPVWYMHAGMKQESNHAISHQHDAYVHGHHWLLKNGIINSARKQALLDSE